MDYKETSIDILSCNSYATIYTCESRQIKKLKQLHQEHPNEVSIITDTTDFINVHVPKSWITSSQNELQRQALSDRLAKGLN